MAWSYALESAPTEDLAITIDGYLVALCSGVDPEAGKVRVAVFQALSGRPPVRLVINGGTGNAVVRSRVMVTPGEPNPVVAYRHGAHCYFTPQGWVDNRSRPLLLPWEISTP